MPDSSDDEAIRRRIAALQDISYYSRVGVVEGVDIDLRHPLIDPEQWTPRHTLWLLDSYPGSDLVFPWMGHSSLAVRLSEARADFKKYRKYYTETLRERLAREAAAFHSEIVLERGDKIHIHDVELVQIGRPFDAEEDRAKALVYLEVLRSTGEKRRVQAPLEFYRSGTLIGPGRHHMLQNLASRICSSFADELGYGNSFESIFSVCLCAARLVAATSDDDLGEEDETFAEILLRRAQRLVQVREILKGKVLNREPILPQMSPGNLA